MISPGYRMRTSGMTLLEVVVGLVLMATLLMTSWSAISHQQHRRALSLKKQQACQIADRLLAQWYERSGQIPFRAQGFFGTDREWLWQTQVIGAASLCGLPLPIIRLDVLGRVGRNPTPQVLCSVDLVQRDSGGGP